MKENMNTDKTGSFGAIVGVVVFFGLNTLASLAHPTNLANLSNRQIAIMGIVEVLLISVSLVVAFAVGNWIAKKQQKTKKAEP